MQVANQKAVKLRDSNMELLRITAMVLVLIVHASIKALGLPTLSDLQTDPNSTFLRLFCESISIICVNLFVLISGWYGIKIKFSRLIAFLFQVYFLNIIIYYISVIVRGGNSVDIIWWIRLCDKYWFVKAYIVLYILTPVLNAFIDKANKKQVKQFLIAFFVVQTVVGFVWSSDFSGGYSALSFIGLYILARYMHLYPNRYTQLSKYAYLSMYFAATIATTAMALLQIIRKSHIMLVYDYCPPFIIFASVCILLFFSKISIRNKVINWTAVSCFAAYVIHCSPIFFSTYLNTIKEWWTHETTFIFLSYTMLWIAGIFITSILLDKARILTWNMITSLFSKTKRRMKHFSNFITHE